MKWLFLIALAFSFVGCKSQHNKVDSDFLSPDTSEMKIDQDTTITIRDSIDVVVEERKSQTMPASIFGGLHFGDRKQTVDRRLLDNKVTQIIVPDGDKVGTVSVDYHEAEYYDDHLASLTLYAEEDELLSQLADLYSTKYGATKNYCWEFSDGEVTILKKHRIPYHFKYNTSASMYYASYTGKGGRLTKDPSFITISYSSAYYLKMIEKQKHEADSLKMIESEKKREEERELAKRLATEPATNI